MLTQNEEAFRALDYGADDFDLPIEDEVTQKAGATIDLDLEALLAVPRRARLQGRVPPGRAAGRVDIHLDAAKSADCGDGPAAGKVDA